MNRNDLVQQRKLKRAGRAILITMIIVPFIPFISAIGVSFHYFTSAVESGTHGSLYRIVSDHGNMIDTFLMERKSDLRLVSAMVGIEKMTRNGQIHEMLTHLKDRSPAFVDLGIFDDQGLHVSYAGPYDLKGKRYQDEGWFKAVMAKGEYVSDVFLGYRNAPHFVIAVCLESEKRRWILRATIDTLFFDRLVSGVRIGKSGEAYVLNHQGIAQTGRRSGEVPMMSMDPGFKNYVSDRTKKSIFMEKEYLHAITSVNKGAWFLVVRQEKRDALSAFYSALYVSVAITLVGGAVIVGLAFTLRGRILHWIERLIHEKESLGSQLIRASQLAEIGEMAAGFAHEINNPLQIIKGEHSLLEMLLREMATESRMEKKDERAVGSSHVGSSDIHFSKEEWNTFVGDTKESLDQIRLQIDRCSEITSAVLKFGRKTETRLQSLSPSDIIPEMLKMVRNKAAVHGVEIHCDIPKNASAFMGDASQFQQVMLNLFNNALDAVVSRHGASGGRLVIQVMGENEKAMADKAVQILANKGVLIRVSDNGMGIRPEHIDKIFSPFFTTKAVGKGSGLGLSVCYGIVESFGGTMSVESRLGEGTTFTIALPTAGKE